MRHFNLLLLLVPLLAPLVASCGSSRRPISVNVLTFNGAMTIPVNGTVQFVANVINSPNQTVTWAVVGGSANGTISSFGLYTAPSVVPTPSTVTISATPQADTTVTGQGSITVIVAVSISPPQATVAPLNTVPFSAMVQGTPNQAVTWAVDGIAGGNLTVGTVSASGMFQAPESVPVNASAGQATTVTVIATSQANSAVSASATVTVTPNNQHGQSTPIDLGTSGGNANDVNATECASGTLGALVMRNGIQYILSNNHVMAEMDGANINDAITQPGLVDAPNPCSSTGTIFVATLSQFITLEQPAGCSNNCAPPADAAIAQVVPGDVATTGDILDLTDTATMSTCCAAEPPASTILPVSSLLPNSTAVAKSGRTTGLTCSTVEAVSVNISVKYQRGLLGPSFTATFANQIVINGGTFSAAGDSGSLVVSQAGAQPIALLFAGNSTSTAGAPVATVLANLPDSSNPPNFPTFVGPATRNPVAGCTSSGADTFSADFRKPSAQAATAKPSAAELSRADSVKNEYASILMTDPAVLAVGVAPSLDRTDRAAVVVFVRQGQPLARPIPQSVGGVITRVVGVTALARAGVLDQQTTASFVKTSVVPAIHPIADQVTAAATAKDKFVASLMKDPAIFGVGVTSSLDNPSEPAILIFVETGKTPSPIPLELGGYRVQVKVTDRFRAFGWGSPRSHRLPGESHLNLSWER